MNALGAIVKEIWSLFVDDGSLAFATLALVALVAAALKLGLLSAPLAGLLLIAGLLAILAENLRRSARRLGPK